MTHDALLRDLRSRFRPAQPGGRLIGLELELLAMEVETGLPVPVVAPEGASSLRALRQLVLTGGWREEPYPGAPRFVPPQGGSLWFEPGGQWEWSSPPCASATTLLRRTSEVAGALTTAAGEHGIRLLAVGIDPVNGVEAAPLRLRTERYARMDAYFAGLGPGGARMMRQTAALQVSLDADPTGSLPIRWRLLQALAPYLTAIFANSARYAGQQTETPSFRARNWRLVDPARTGLLPDTPDPADAYLRWALDAPALLWPGTPPEAAPPFRALLADGVVRAADWDAHLSTLFPEVRPQGRLEVRSPDAIPPRWAAAPVALLSGLAYHQPTTRAALDLLGPADPELLGRAAQAGLQDTRIARVASDLWQLGLGGAESLGPGWIGPEEMATARAWGERYVLRGRSPADDPPEATALRPRA